MGKFAVADAELASIVICMRCKSRNKVGTVKCRKCGYPSLRPKRKSKHIKK